MAAEGVPQAGEVSSEAVEAQVRAIVHNSRDEDHMVEGITSWLVTGPLAAHQPACVVPSAEEVRAALMPESIRATQRTLYGEFSAPFISVDAAITVILALFARGETKGGK